ncbi:hypothetical protein [Quadrisphaera sp. DSM 44207]|uniref:hypothetical protein n=1 Tax=Quadrisphaera sp. DSM 44207 TaxID=1881057 RepID=UPI00115FCA4F|nr:hypothetical protein [Quadrisphaera sp. DSM 44207]
MDRDRFSSLTGDRADGVRLPAWAEADPRWWPLALAWADAHGDPVAAVLVACRHVPGTGRFLAVLTSAPVLLREPGSAPEEVLGAWLPAATALLHRRGAFAVRAGHGRSVRERAR